MKKRVLSMILVLVMVLGMLPISALAAPPADTVTAYLYYKANGKVPIRNGEVTFSDTDSSSYGPSGNNTPMASITINTKALRELAGQRNSPVEYGTSGGWPEWYFRPTDTSEAGIQAFWQAVLDCTTDVSGLQATGLMEDFTGYVLKRNIQDSQGYYVHLDGILNVKENATVYTVELYDENNTYFGGMVTEDENGAVFPGMTDVYAAYEKHLGADLNLENGPAVYTDASGNTYRVSVVQTNSGSTEKNGIRYSKKTNTYYIASFRLVKEKITTYTVTYEPGVVPAAFRPEVYTGLMSGVNTPAFTGGTPEDPSGRYEFNGWRPTVAKEVTGNATYTAQWVENTYTVTWKDSNGTELEKDVNVAYGTMPTYDNEGGTTAELAAAKSNAQYTYAFAGWSPTVSEVTRDVTYTATYTVTTKDYTVTWVDGMDTADTGDDVVLEVDEDVAYGTTPTYDNARGLGTTAERTAAKSNAQYTYRFAGWTPTVSEVTGDITYTATYTKTVNTYTVTWLNFNGTQLEQDTGVAYGATPEYNSAVPTRPDTAQFTFTFTGWSPTISPVTGNQTYTAQFEATQKNYAITLKLYLDGNPVDSSVIHAAHGESNPIPVFKTSPNATVEYAGQKTDDTGVYKATDVPNGIYRIYHEDSEEPVCNQIIVVSNADVTKECHYYSVNYVGGVDGVKNVPARTVHHMGTSASVSEDVPTRDGWTFKGWAVDNTVLQPGEQLTASMSKTYTLTAQWEKKVNVKINVTIDHGTADGYDQLDTKDDVSLALVSRESSTAPYLETGATLTLNGASDTRFTYSYDDTNKVTTYTASGYTYTDLPGGTTEYSVVTSKHGYETEITSTKENDGNWTINVVMTYAPSNFDLDFTVKVDKTVPEAHVPDAAIVKVTYWNGEAWKIITQQEGGKPGVRVDIGSDRTGFGSYPVWKYESGTNNKAYGYRIVVSAFVYPDGTIVAVPNPESSTTAWADSVYTATMIDESDIGGMPFGTLNGAYYSDNTKDQAGTLEAVITAALHDVTILGNGGTFNGQATVAWNDQITMPIISGYVPTHATTGYIFDGYDWYVDKGTVGVYDEGTDTAASALSAGTKLSADYILVAKWKAPWTIQGDIKVDGTYELNGTKVINDADRIKTVTVLLQYASANSAVFTNRDAQTVTITYADNQGTGSYSFANVPNDGGTWRVHVLNHNYTTTYDNEATDAFKPETDSSKPNYAVDVVAPLNVAEVDAHMAFAPQNFDLWFQVVTDKIGTGFIPTKAEVLVLYDDNPASSNSPREWPVISQMQKPGSTTEFTGVTVDVNADPSSYSVWNYHPQDYLYDYAIRVPSVLNPGKTEYEPITDSAPYTISYNGSAEYANPGYADGKNQTQLLTAVLTPKSYPVRYYLTQGSTVELHTMKDGAIKVSSHTWSHDTALKNDNGTWKDIPTRVGYVFNGWVDASGTKVTAIDAEVHAETKLYAAWVEDNWKDAEKTPEDGDKDSPTGGDGIPDSEQIHIVYRTDGNGTTAPVGEIVTLPQGNDPATSVKGSVPTAAEGYAYDKWVYVGAAAETNDYLNFDATDKTKLIPSITDPVGGTTYTFKAYFAEDIIGNNGGGDDIPDKYQALVKFVTSNAARGTVEGAVYQVTTFQDANGNYVESGTVKPVLKENNAFIVTVDPENGWAFDYWYCPYLVGDNHDHDDTIHAHGLSHEEVDGRSIPNVTGGTTIVFEANFAIDEWKDDPDPDKPDSPEGGDKIPDHRQVLVSYVAAANGRGTVTGADAVQVFTLTTITNGKYTGTITPSKTNLVVTANEKFAFDYWGDLEGFWGDAGAKLDDAKPFAAHNVEGGDIITYVAHFADDNWKDADKTTDPDDKDTPTGGDGIPDNKQILINYVSEDTAKGTVAPALEIVTLDPTKTETNAAGSTVDVKDGYALKAWTTDALNAEYDPEEETIAPVIINAIGGETYEFKATFGKVGLDVKKSLLTDATAKVGDEVKWEILVANTGDIAIENITVTDTLTVGEKQIALKVVDETGAEVTSVDLDSHEGVILYASYTVTKEDAGNTLSNYVVVKGNDGDNDPTNDPKDEDTNVEGNVEKPKTPADPVSPIKPVPGKKPALNKEDHVAYVIGYEDGTVRPQNNITRAEVATIFFRLLTDESRAYYWSQSNDFSDVSANDWFNNAVSTMSKAGIITGYPDGTFGPNKSITRAEFAAIAARFSDVVYGGKCSFTDVPLTHWASDEIALAEHLGWITGYPDNTFHPNQNITRAEAMTLINRVLERAVEEEHMLPDMVTWTDNKPAAWYYEAVQEATNSHTYTRLDKKVPNQSFYYEDWLKILTPPDWAALEKSWSDANDQ